jgi:hypothetical protein
MATRAIPNVEDLEEGYNQMFTDSYETSPISVVEEMAIVDKTFTFHGACTETMLFTATGAILRNGQEYGKWSVEPLERPAPTRIQQPGKWTQLVVHLVGKVILISFGDYKLQMVVLRDESTGRLYLQERDSGFHNADGEIVMANGCGERTIWGST